MTKWLMAISLLFVCGCGAEFIAGVGTGVVIQEIARSVETTARINSESGSAIKSFKDRAKDPVAWIALGSVLLNAFVGRKMYKAKT